jgi:hypothetical protein
MNARINVPPDCRPVGHKGLSPCLHLPLLRLPSSNSRTFGRILLVYFMVLLLPLCRLSSCFTKDNVRVVQCFHYPLALELPEWLYVRQVQLQLRTHLNFRFSIIGSTPGLELAYHNRLQNLEFCPDSIAITTSLRLTQPFYLAIGRRRTHTLR